MKKIIPFYYNPGSNEDLLSLSDSINSGQLIYNKSVDDFEKLFLGYTSAKYAIGTNSATSALHLALILAGISNEQTVVVPSITYTASANVVKYVNANLIFCDVDKKTGLICLDSLQKILEKSSVHAVISVNLGGNTPDYLGLNRLKEKYSFIHIEDAAQGFFTKFNSEYCGKYADFTAYSFHPNKVLSSVDGGMLCFNDSRYYERSQLLKNAGVKKSLNMSWQYDVQDLGFKYAMNSISASLLCHRIKDVERNYQKRKQQCEIYDKLLQTVKNVEILKSSEGSNFHLYRIFVQKRDQLAEYLKEQGIDVSVHYRPLHLHSFWAEDMYKKVDLTGAEEYFRNVVSLPLYPSLTEEDQKYVVSRIENFFS